MATIATGVATTAVMTADEEQDEKQQNYNERGDSKDLHPAWRAGGRSAVGVVALLGISGRLGHVTVLSRGGRQDTRDGEVYETVCRYQIQSVSCAYTGPIPKLWNETIETHRREVRDATLDTTAALVAKHGLRSVTMSQIAEETGIARATLYKYFSGVEAILVAWHERQVTGHLEYLADVRDQAGNAAERLEAVLEAYALISQEYHGTELAALVHRGEHLARAQHHLSSLIRDLVSEAAETGDVRDDVAPDELASYCLHALAGASSLRSKTAVHRLVTVTLAGLRPPR